MSGVERGVGNKAASGGLLSRCTDCASSVDMDALFSLRNAFYLGSYSTAVAEASTLSTEVAAHSPEAQEMSCLMYRAAIAQGTPEIAVEEIDTSAASGLQAVKLYAKYTMEVAGGAGASSVLDELMELATDPSCAGNATVQLMAATVHAAEGNTVEALRCCSNVQSLETLAMSVQLLLAMNRPELAEKHVRTMSEIDDDATLTQLATAWLNLTLGGAKVQEASYIFQELGDKFSVTVPLINGTAVCMMRMGRYDDAEKELLEALSKDSKHPETLANLFVCALHNGKPSARYMNQLKMVAPKHSLVLRSEELETQFDVVVKE